MSNSKFLTGINSLLNHFLYKDGRGHAVENSKSLPSEAPEGLHGKLDADAVIVAEDDRLVLSINHSFEDVPSWVEWDLRSGGVNVVQMSGAVAQLDLTLPAAKKKELAHVKRIALVTGKGPEKLMHYVSFVTRDA